VPQSGDGDLWPTDDGDTSSKSAEGDSTHQMPVPPRRPDQQEQRQGAKPSAGGWFDGGKPAAAAEEQPAATAERDEPHADRASSEPLRAEEPRTGRAEGKQKTDEPRLDEQSPDQWWQPQQRPDQQKASDQARQFDPRPQTGQRSEQADQPTQADQQWHAEQRRRAEQQRQSDQRQSEQQQSAEQRQSDQQQPANQRQAEQQQPANQRQSEQRQSEQQRQPEQWQSDQRQPDQRQRPEQQRTQPVNWPVADLERQAHSQEATRQLKVPPPEAAATGFFSRPLPPEQRRDAEATAYFGAPPRQDALPRQDAPPRQDDLRQENRHDDSPPRAEPRLFSGQPRQEWPPPEPPRAAPVRVGPPQDEPEPEAEPRKRRRPLLIAAIAIVAVVGIAAGVIFGVPGVAAKLGLKSDEPAVVIDPPAAPVAFTPKLVGPNAGAPTPTAQGVEAALAGPIADPALGTVTGVVIDPATGQPLWEKGGDTAIVPASTGKLLTAAAVLLTLDHTQQLSTKVVQGEEPGSVVIVGGGDPSLSSLKPGLQSMYPGAAHLTELVDQVKASGVPVQTVYIDQSRYTGPDLEPSWIPADVTNGYITPIVPAMLDGGRADATVNYSPRTGNPGGDLVDEFATRIGATAPPSAEKKAPAGAKVLGEVKSAPMAQLVDNMLDHSDNVLGETLAHEVAIKAGQEPSFEGGSKATLDVLRQNKFTVDGVSWVDGSGLSDANKVPAKLLAEILAVAAGPDGKDPRTAKLRPLLGGLPVAGGSGTLEDRYKGGTSDARGWLRAKTGSLTGVNSLAGIVLDKDNRPLVFAFLTSGTTLTTARPALDAVSAALRGCGCQ